MDMTAKQKQNAWLQICSDVWDKMRNNDIKWYISHSNEAQPLFSLYQKRSGNFKIKTKLI